VFTSEIVVKCLGVAPGYANAWPRAAIKLQMPHPRTDNVSKCPAVAREGMGKAGID